MWDLYIWIPKSYGTVLKVNKAPVDQTKVLDHGLGMESAEKPNAVLSKLFSGKLLENFTVDNSTYSLAQVRATCYPKFENEKSDQERRGGSKEHRWVEKPKSDSPSTSLLASAGSSSATTEDLTNRLNTLSVAESKEQSVVSVPSLQFGSIGLANHARGQKSIWKPKSYGTISEATAVKVDKAPVDQTKVLDHGPETESAQKPKSAEKPNAVLSKLFSGKLLENFTVDNSTYSLAQVRATFYPKFENEKSDQEDFCNVYYRQVSLKHSGSLFMYAGHEGGAYAKNSYGNIYTAVGVFVLGRMFREAWGSQSTKKQAEKSVTSFFAAYDALCEEGTATSVCKALDEVADISVPGSKDHIKVQGEILEGLVARIVSPDSSEHMEQVLRDYPPPQLEGADLGSSLREICAANRTDEKQASDGHSRNADRSVLSKFLQARPADYSTTKLQANKGRAAEFTKETDVGSGTNGATAKEGLADEDANLMIKQMQKWNTSAAKQRELSKMLDEWAVFIRRKYGHKQLSSSTYLSEAEPFLEQYAKRSPQNQVLIGSAGSLVRSEDFMAIIDGGRDEEGDLEQERDIIPSSPTPTVKEAIRKDEGLIVFFPGIPGCAKSALCKEILSTPGALGDDRPVHSLMGDLIKAKYWGKVAEERRKKPYSILLADKNAPNEEVWRQIEDMCRSTKASAVPVVPDSEGTESNPFSLDALAVFIFRVLGRVNHPNRNEFEAELIERFGSLVKMPLLESNRSEPTKGTYAKEWAKWEKQLRETLLGNAEYLNSIQVPFESSVESVLKQLKAIAKGEYTAPSTEKRKFGNIVFAAVSLPVSEILDLLCNLGEKDPRVEGFLKDKNLKSSFTKAHLTLAHKRSHGVTAVASYGPYVHQNVPVDMVALLFSDKLAAFEAEPGVVDGEKLSSRNEWPHVTLWTAQGVAAKEANMLPNLLAEGKAIRVELNPPITITGVLEFF
ncbi:hypothetical protein DH2020_000132 [Rehmannia glutinosa]|uniref:tRNA ligase phosphodiesterase domain-containing protein n=1 Tax=Rehmannia glutinosa TaxID=99300 RepID=A0ABR0XW26_REHGL